MAQESRLEMRERDQAGVLVATYIGSSRGAKNERIDVVIPRDSTSYIKAFMSAFLPAGYPQSVTKDYLPYQIYDSLQAFSSSIAGLLASRAVLEGVGVGDANASATGAILLSILQESMGRIATILFAHRLGTSLEPECKMYRLAADVFNDAAMVLDCLSPAFPKASRVLLLSCSSILRALCGVAAGSSKASLSAHFATQGNLGELNAKDSSQETVISLLGMLAGSMVVSYISTPFATWVSLIFLLAVHLGTNYLAVRSVSMRTINRQRANIIFNNYMFGAPMARHILIPEKVSQLERVFEWDGVLRCGKESLACCSIGVPLKAILDVIGNSNKATGSFQKLDVNIDAILTLFNDEQYVLWFNPKKRQFLIVLKNGSDTKTQLKAWFHSLLFWLALCEDKKRQVTDSVTHQQQHVPGETFKCLKSTIPQIEKLWVEMLPLMLKQGWDMETGALETKSGTRLDLKSA